MKRLLAAIAAFGAALPVAAEPVSGVTLFRQNCATCHGLDARGNGPMAGVLSVAVPDLTGLAAAAGGAFPMAEVVAVIDGRRAFPAHGGPMPIFGFTLSGEMVVLTPPAGGEIATSQEIAALAQWLESVQE
ncbi:mono/diheme cytochrome c family protein [Rhodovulum iodosum]|uniref:Mono/diheme cytochrome c family protein n=1 Tax=Rhodovulum iodosum TaxID=68291 RepID=A0ABV3XR33_9RHOB|nr:cytochrome c [Rhodovulum robiginosum]